FETAQVPSHHQARGPETCPGRRWRRGGDPSGPGRFLIAAIPTIRPLNSKRGGSKVLPPLFFSGRRQLHGHGSSLRRPTHSLSRNQETHTEWVLGGTRLPPSRSQSVQNKEARRKTRPGLMKSLSWIELVFFIPLSLTGLPPPREGRQFIARRRLPQGSRPEQR